LNGSSDFLQSVGMWFFMVLGAIWGTNLAFGFFASFIISGYPNEISERHLFLPLKALPWVIISPFTYFGVVYGFYCTYILWMLIDRRFGPFATFAEFCARVRDGDRGNIPKWFYWFA
jgi:hypothetical protein